MIIGICGKSCSGKSSLANQIIELTNNNAIHLDIDKVGHNVLLLPEIKEKLINSFGDSIIEDNVVVRKKLGKIVFKSKNEMNKLITITWNSMQKEINKFLSDNKDKIIILDWLLLPNTEFFDLCDIKILLDIPYEVRKKRAMMRDSISDNEFALRENASIEVNPELFDYVINSIEVEAIRKMIRPL